jgi:hypothetical protein
MLKLLLITIILVAVAIAAIAIKMFVQKGGQFSKSCSTVDLDTGEKIGCVCGDDDQKRCVNYEKHHGVLKEG